MRPALSLIVWSCAAPLEKNRWVIKSKKSGEKYILLGQPRERRTICKLENDGMVRGCTVTTRLLQSCEKEMD